jgi:hypothetical protein
MVLGEAHLSSLRESNPRYGGDYQKVRHGLEAARVGHERAGVGMATFPVIEMAVFT